MVTLDEILALQRFYPRIYLACHTNHVRRKSTPFALTSNESSLLAHLDKTEARTASELADHLGVADSTLSAALTRLEKAGCVLRSSSKNDKRVTLLRLAEKGEAALAATSVLETDRVRALLAKLRPSTRRQAVHGLALLAQAAERLQKDHALSRRKKIAEQASP
jgi:MarR family transcriptional regulator, organic hydroperoxide resistance regulator